MIAKLQTQRRAHRGQVVDQLAAHRASLGPVCGTGFGVIAVDLRCIVARADEEPIRGTFSAIDGDGAMSHGEFGTSFYDVVTAGQLTLGEDVVTGKQEFTLGVAAHVFRAWDADDDDSLSLREYSDVRFDLIDRNHNGAINLKHVRTV